MVYVCLAEGFEEIEALAVVDILRRAGLTVKTVGIGSTSVCGSHGIRVEADLPESEASTETMTAVVLPGGLPGANNLDKSETVQRLLTAAMEKKTVIGAICAAPFILGRRDILKGKRATCYPGYESELIGATVTGEAAVTDGAVVTGKGAGAVFAFAFALVERLVSAQKATELREAMQCP